MAISNPLSPLFELVGRTNRQETGLGAGHDLQTERMLVIFAQQEHQRSFQQRRVWLLFLGWIVSTGIRDKSKRLFDLVMCFLALPLILPVMGFVALAIKLDSYGPVLFRQKRVGKWGTDFTCYKFRSMVHDAEQRKAELLDQNEADGVVFKIRDDPRVTRVGRVLRKLSLDELPQFFNVLKGDMSLVGPRPPVPFEVEHYEYDYFQRLDAVPGITGLQQVSGRSDLKFSRWLELDIEYIQKQGLLNDIWILLRTIPTVILGKGAY